MRWLWNNVIKPFMSGAADTLWAVFKWAFHNPTVSTVAGAAMVVVSCFIDDDAVASYVASFGWTLLASGVLGWLTGAAGGVVKKALGNYGRMMTDAAALGAGP